ncbi:MAG: sugar transferase [Clostridia bacterium]|nr:sugar transferase [Clostridia bacterium]
MILCKWEQLPKEMQTDAVRQYYNALKHKQFSLVLKRIFDIIVSAIMLVILLPVFIILAILIKADSQGPVFYRQERVTQYGRKYKIFKFRTMVTDADKYAKVTVNNDSRITCIGAKIRKYRLDEICQLIDILRGTMTFVGTRPEVPKYVECYSDEMLATLLLPAGVTSEASIYYKDEAQLLDSADDVDKIYIEKILPDKMYYNLREIKNFSFWHDIKIMFMTVFAVLGKEYTIDIITEKMEEEEIVVK